MTESLKAPRIQQVFFSINIKFSAAWVLQHGNSLNTATPKCLAQKEKGGRERRGDVVGVRGGLTKNHFNRNSWVMALPQAKNNISSMSAVRRGLSQAPWPAPAPSQAQASLWSFLELMSSHMCPPRGSVDRDERKTSHVEWEQEDCRWEKFRVQTTWLSKALKGEQGAKCRRASPSRCSQKRMRAICL